MTNNPQPTTHNLQGQVSIITGGARGIGLAIAKRLAAEGSALVIADVNAEGAEQAARELAHDGVQALGIGVDITSPEGRERMVNAALETYGRIDILINNAGIMQRVDLMNVTPEIWERTMGVNLNAAFFCCQAVLPTMKERGSGRIISITSMSARTGGQASPPHYATSKTGLVGMTRALARVVGAWGVTVNAVAPGIIDTEMIAALTDEQRQWWLDQIPLSRLGTVEDVAGVVAFLAGPDAAYITGATIDINGGFYMT